MKITARNRTKQQDTRHPLRSVHLIEDGPVSHSLDTLVSLKNRLLDERLGSETNPGLVERLRRAADDSASLAWASPFPLLTLPELLAEKVLEAERHHARQIAIQSRGPTMFSLAA